MSYYDLEDIEVEIDTDYFPEEVLVGDILGTMVPCYYKGPLRGSIQELIDGPSIHTRWINFSNMQTSGNAVRLEIDLVAFIFTFNNIRIEEAKRHMNSSVDMETLQISI